MTDPAAAEIQDRHVIAARGRELPLIEPAEDFQKTFMASKVTSKREESPKRDTFKEPLTITPLFNRVLESDRYTTSKVLNASATL